MALPRELPSQQKIKSLDFSNPPHRGFENKRQFADFSNLKNARPDSWRSFINDDVDGSRRGSAIARLYGLLVRRALDPIVALDVVRLFNNAHCRPPLEDGEVVRIANDIAGREASRRRGSP